MEQTLVEALGGWIYLVAPLLMVVVAILPIPAEFPAMINGMVFGPVVGSAITWGGAMVGAVASFEIAHQVGRPLAKRLLRPTTLMRADRAVASVGWPTLLFLRLMPAVAFTAVNWAAGLTSLDRRTFVWTTALGILPGAVLFTSSGTGLAAVYRMNPIAASGLVVFAALAMWFAVARYRRRPLRLWTGEMPVVISDRR